MYFGGEDDPSTPQDERYRVVPLLRGTGRGTDAEMHYMPSKIQDDPEEPTCAPDGTPKETQPNALAVQTYETIEPESLAELQTRFEWSVLRIYNLNAPGQNHGIVLGTSGWRPTRD